MHHPWRAFRALTEWTLRIVRLPVGVTGFTHWESRSVLLDDRLSQVERRCTIAHEVTHIQRGPAPPEPVLAAREELAVEKATARKLITIHALGEALAWADGDIHQAADELWVDVQTLIVRLRHLHPAERGYLKERLQ